MARLFCNWMLIVVVILTASVKAVAADQCQGFKFIQVQSLSLQDLGRMTQQKIVTGETGSVVFIPFDEEDYPQQGKFHAVGLVFARVGDLGETPIGGYIWISKDANYQSYEGTKTVSSVSIKLHALGARRCAASLVFELKQMGKVYVNGAFIGTVR